MQASRPPRNEIGAKSSNAATAFTTTATANPEDLAARVAASRLTSTSVEPAPTFLNSFSLVLCPTSPKGRSGAATPWPKSDLVRRRAMAGALLSRLRQVWVLHRQTLALPPALRVRDPTIILVFQLNSSHRKWTPQPYSLTWIPTDS